MFAFTLVKGIILTFPYCVLMFNGSPYGWCGKVVEHKHDCSIRHVCFFSLYMMVIVYFVLHLQKSCRTAWSVMLGQICRFYSSVPSNIKQENYSFKVMTAIYNWPFPWVITNLWNGSVLSDISWCVRTQKHAAAANICHNEMGFKSQLIILHM